MAVSLVEYEKALNALDEAIGYVAAAKTPAEIGLFRDAAIQRFEFSIELAWKISAKVLGSQSTAAKPVIREMAQNELITDVPLWFEFIEARNKTSHTYDERVAKEVFQNLLKFSPEGHALLAALKTK